jgi:hypothetical protein
VRTFASGCALKAALRDVRFMGRVSKGKSLRLVGMYRGRRTAAAVVVLLHVLSQLTDGTQSAMTYFIETAKRSTTNLTSLIKQQ